MVQAHEVQNHEQSFICSVGFNNKRLLLFEFQVIYQENLFVVNGKIAVITRKVKFMLQSCAQKSVAAFYKAVNG